MPSGIQGIEGLQLVNCRNFHADGQDPNCPYCVARCLATALEKIQPNAPELTVYIEMVAKAFRKVRRVG